jgi:chromosome partition protein MukF
MNDADPHRFIASLSRDRVTLELKTVDLCFLAGLYLRADKAGLASFDEDLLVDMFEQVCDVVEPSAENPRLRATKAIQRLRDQRMLARVDGGQLMRAGEYALTRLAASVVEFYLADDALTRESLTLLTATLRAQIAEALAIAKKAETEDDWRAVTGPLRVTVADLVSGIERRQRGLDTQQEEIQAEIARLLSTDWFHAVERCQVLLDTTTSTLRELNEVLLRDTHHFVALLQEIQTLAGDGTDAEATVQRVIEHVDRIGAWGSARLHAWSDYYQYVHRYLRDVVRLDPARALSQRLRDQLAAWAGRPFYVAVADEPPIVLLRPVEARIERPVVARPRTEREVAPEWVEPVDLQTDLEALVDEALERGATTLVDASAYVLERVAEPARYKSAGRVAELVANRCVLSYEHERPWLDVIDRLEVEDWELDPEPS